MWHLRFFGAFGGLEGGVDWGAEREVSRRDGVGPVVAARASLIRDYYA